MLIMQNPELTMRCDPKAVYTGSRSFLRNAGLATAPRSLAAAFGNRHAIIVFFAGTKLDVAAKSPFSKPRQKQNTYDDVTHYNNYYEFGETRRNPLKNAANSESPPDRLHPR